jgi:hypothetical protein
VSPRLALQRHPRFSSELIFSFALFWIPSPNARAESERLVSSISHTLSCGQLPGKHLRRASADVRRHCSTCALLVRSYDPSLNSINFPAGIIQTPFFTQFAPVSSGVTGFITLARA